MEPLETQVGYYIGHSQVGGHFRRSRDLGDLDLLAQAFKVFLGQVRERGRHDRSVLDVVNAVEARPLWRGYGEAAVPEVQFVDGSDIETSLQDKVLSGDSDVHCTLMDKTHDIRGAQEHD